MESGVPAEPEVHREDRIVTLMFCHKREEGEFGCTLRWCEEMVVLKQTNRGSPGNRCNRCILIVSGWLSHALEDIQVSVGELDPLPYPSLGITRFPPGL